MCFSVKPTTHHHARYLLDDNELYETNIWLDNGTIETISSTFDAEWPKNPHKLWTKPNAIGMAVCALTLLSFVRHIFRWFIWKNSTIFFFSFDSIVRLPGKCVCVVCWERKTNQNSKSTYTVSNEVDFQMRISHFNRTIQPIESNTRQASSPR